MRRDKTKLEARAEYVKNQILERPVAISRAVEQLSNELFLSERTIWNDLEKGFNSDA